MVQFVGAGCHLSALHDWKEIVDDCSALFYYECFSFFVRDPSSVRDPCYVYHVVLIFFRLLLEV